MKTGILKKLIAAAGVVAAMATTASADTFDAKSDGNWLIRARGIGLVPQESSNLSLAGLEARADAAFTPELDFTYFFTPNIAAELILATTKHDMSTVGAANLSLGHVWLLPPTLTLQYHVTELGKFKPYVGAGVNYTIFYGGNSGAATSVEYEDGFGFALQAGIDYEISEGVYLNADVKKIWLGTDVTVTGPNVTGSVDLDPWVFGLGVGYRF